jgi:hypothetical protein
MNQKPFRFSRDGFFYFIVSPPPLKIQLHILLQAITLIINGIIFASYHGNKNCVKSPLQKNKGRQLTF